MVCPLEFRLHIWASNEPNMDQKFYFFTPKYRWIQQEWEEKENPFSTNSMWNVKSDDWR